MVYNNDLADDLASNTKLFAHDAYLFSVIDDVENSELNNDLYQINKWAFQWKVNFNQNPSKQIQEIFFFVKKLRKFLILPYVLITALSCKLHIKNTLAHFLMLN